MVAIKICGITRVEDAIACIEAGADAIGINFAPGSPRYCDPARARAIVDAVGGRALTVGVFVDATLEEILRIQAATQIRCIQLHGDEPPSMVQALLPHAYKALRVRGPEVVAQAEAYPGPYILLDAYVPGAHGGTGACFDWQLAGELARDRKLALAGGLTPHNVAHAIRIVQPFCVDVASGVESAPGIKDGERIAAFVDAARNALIEA